MRRCWRRSHKTKPTKHSTCSCVTGVNHIDVAACYGDAELRLAPWLKTHRDRFFLAAKSGGRTYDTAKRQIHLSLERLGVDRFTGAVPGG